MLEPQTAEDPQAQLLHRIAARDRDALAEFYDQSSGLLYSTALRIVGDAQEAEEVIQDVFVQIWEKATRFDPAIGVASHWALSITRNRAIDRVRARQRRSRLMIELEESADAETLSASPASNDRPSIDELATVRAALSQLPQDQRQAIEMAFFGGLTHHEIAATLKEPLGTVKARIRRGMLKLRENLPEFA